MFAQVSVLLGSGSGWFGRPVTSGPQFESSHRQNLCCLLPTVLQFEKTKWKMPVMVHLKKYRRCFSFFIHPSNVIWADATAPHWLRQRLRKNGISRFLFILSSSMTLHSLPVSHSLWLSPVLLTFIPLNNFICSIFLPPSIISG